MFASRGGRAREERLSTRRRLHEEPRDIYAKSADKLELKRGRGVDGKFWEKKYEEERYKREDERQKYRPNRPYIDERDYRLPEHHHYHNPRYPERSHLSRSRSPAPHAWSSHPVDSYYRAEYGSERKYDRRKTERIDREAYMASRNEPIRSSSYHKPPDQVARRFPRNPITKQQIVSKIKSRFLYNAGRLRPRPKPVSDKFKHFGPSNRLHDSSKKSSGFPMKDELTKRKSSERKRSLSRISSGDVKSRSASTEHLEKRKKYLVDRLAEYEHRVERQARNEGSHRRSPHKQPDSRDDQHLNKTNKILSSAASSHSNPRSPSCSSSVQSFDDREEANHYNLNFPNADDDDYPEENLEAIKPLDHPEYVVFPLTNYKPLFIREGFRKKRDEALRGEERMLIENYRKHGLKKDSAENKKFHINQLVSQVEKYDEPGKVISSVDAKHRRVDETTTDDHPNGSTKHSEKASNLLKKPNSQSVANNQKLANDSFDLRQRIFERQQKRQTFSKKAPIAHDKPCDLPHPTKINPLGPSGDASHSVKTSIRRVVSNNAAPISLIRTFPNRPVQSKRSIIITQPMSSSRFHHQ